MRFYEVMDTFTKCGFTSVTIVNSYLIFLTVFHIKRVTGTYKAMVLIFSTIGIMFSSWELIARPFVHNYNKGFIFFSLNTWLEVPQKFLQVALVIYASFYLWMVSLIAVQFLFRYYTLVNPKIAKKFSGKGVGVWLLYSLFCGLVYGSLVFYFGQPDEYSDEYMKEEMIQTYGLVVDELPRILMIPYDSDGSVRINVLFLILGGFNVAVQYIIIIYCGLRMHIFMTREFARCSIPNKKLQKQFFRALIVQTVVPTILFVFPAFFVLFCPLLDMEMHFQTGWIYAALSLYPPIDSLAFMLLISEYRRVTKELFKLIFPDKPRQVANGSATLAKTG